MSNKNKILLFLLICASLISCRSKHHTQISTSDSGNELRFTAFFPTSKTEKVERFIHKSLQPANLFANGHEEVDATMVLSDDTRLHIKSAAGRLKIEFDKNRNSEASYERVRKLCEGIKEIIVAQ
ncbi:MAG: hypothetical protein H7Y31_08470 [Chitinophagaceae bacterium]|nr:hypothetical protein [Chitinophagaceae bacterium]